MILFHIVTFFLFGTEKGGRKITLPAAVAVRRQIPYEYEVPSLHLVMVFQSRYLCTRPEPSPPAKASTSSRLTRLKSPSTVCLRQDAATANSKASESDIPVLSP